MTNTFRKTLKFFLHFFYRPLVKYYLSKKRFHTYKGITVTVMPGVFHPGLFLSTHFLIDYLQKINLTSKKLLELGCGTGLISIFSAKSGAVVTASDSSTIALNNAKDNAESNKVPIEFIQSDLFDSIPETTYDYIVINPPYYPRSPDNDAERAWYCGENFEYFVKLFSQVGHYINDKALIIMVLSEDCNLERIESIANGKGFTFNMIRQKRISMEKNFIFQIQSNLFGYQENS